MRKIGGDFYGVSLEKKVQKILDEFFLSAPEIRVIDVVKKINVNADHNTYRRVVNALKNIGLEGEIILEKKSIGKYQLPTYIIRKKCLER